jgi:glycine amidinotransferase
VLNSFDEWSRLKEVIVGSALRQFSVDCELSFKLFFYDTPASSFWYPCYEAPSGLSPSSLRLKPRAAMMQRYVDELNEDLEVFVQILISQGIVVRRPLEMTGSPSIASPYWSSGMNPALNVRDQALILGDEIIETPPQIRSRYFENDLLKPTFYRYFEQGAKWTVMPRPIMTDRSFDLSYVSQTSNLRWDDILSQAQSPYDVGFEMMIDAAQCLRFGRDVIVNVANENHELSVRWLERHTQGRFRFHRLTRMADNHIDSIVLPLRPGTLLMRHRKYRDFLPAPLRGWDIIEAPEPRENMFPTYEDDILVLTSKYIDLNVLSIDENTILANALFPELIRLLEARGFTVIPIRHRHRRIFGGGFHCFTLDTVRAAGMIDYFQ